MKKNKVVTTVSKFVFGLGLLALSSVVFAIESDAAQNMHRVYNPNSGEHFYTANGAEKDSLVKVGWKYEGIGWVAPDKGADVYRVYNPNSGDHHYTLNYNEKENLVRLGWRDEGIGWKSGGSVPLYRAYNPNAKTGSHHFTTSLGERNQLVTIGWHNEGIAWYGEKAGKPLQQSGLGGEGTGLGNASGIENSPGGWDTQGNTGLGPWQ